MSKTPNIEKLQEYLKDVHSDDLLSIRVRSTLSSMGNIQETFLDKQTYVPLLEAARKRGQKTFDTIAGQVFTISNQVGPLSEPTLNESQKSKRKLD